MMLRIENIFRKAVNRILLMAGIGSAFVGCLQSQNTYDTPHALDLYEFSYSAGNQKKANEEYMKEMIHRNPRWLSEREEYDSLVAEFVSANHGSASGRAVIAIPVVVHILYKQAFENVSDSQVFSQIQVLNEDFSRTAADTSNTPAPFALIAADAGIQFCLAQRDPDGNPSTGIERRQTAVDTFGFDDGVKFFSKGGLDIWDPTKYFNIWVCNTGGVSWGEFPVSSPTSTHGIVMYYGYFGSKYTSFGNFPNINSYWDRGEICVHEAGHALNLRHIWGDDGTACTGSDTCSDTPDQQGPSAFCPVFPLLDSCTPAGDGVMFMNFMDYADDDCQNMFTSGQAARMNAVLGMPPYSGLAVSDGCQPVILLPNDAAIIKSQDGQVCDTVFAPAVTLKNWGLNPLASCIIYSQLDTSPAVSYNWTGNLPSLSTAIVSLNPVAATAGIHTFTASTSLPNGSIDAQPANDMSSDSFFVFAGGIPLPFVEGFENAAFPPANWSLNNPDKGKTWFRTIQAFSSGLASAKMNNITYNQKGEMDELQTDPIDLATLVNPTLTFELAYTYYVLTNPPLTHTDTLTVLISTDCGETWAILLHEGGAQLATTAPLNFEFIPNSTQWQQRTIALNNFQGIATAMIKFRNTTGWANQMYLDDINITGVVAGETVVRKPVLQVYPNPAEDRIYLDAGGLPISSIRIYDIRGKSILSGKGSGTGLQQIDLSGFSSGLYFVQAVLGDGRILGAKIRIENY